MLHIISEYVIFNSTKTILLILVVNIMYSFNEVNLKLYVANFCITGILVEILYMNLIIG